MAERGSEKLFNKRNVFDKEQLLKVVEVSEAHGRILDWCWYGQPGIDGFCARVRVDRGVAARLVKELLEIDEPRIIFKGFPEGIPDPTDVLFELGTGMNRAGG